MNRIGLGLRFVAGVAFLPVFFALAQQPATTPPGPVPQAILAAKTIFLSNPGTASALYSGGQNRAYDQFYAALQAANVFQLVGDPADADLVLEIELIDSGPGTAKFRLLIYDRKTHFLLWTLLEPIGFCNRQKSCDANFDDALPALLLNFEKLAGKTPGAPPRG